MPSSTAPSAPPLSAVILAAGVGRRLGNMAPKVLLDFAGKTLLERHIAALDANGVRDIAITLGHRPDLIRNQLSRIGPLHPVPLVPNPRYPADAHVSPAR